jgi:arsenate reductase-like glutaredoxin family protein
MKLRESIFLTVHLNLYSTTNCHLCEEAESLLSSLNNQYNFISTNIEIAEDITLLALYELKIPVLKRIDNNQEICWPFSIDEIKKLLIQ